MAAVTSCENTLLYIIFSSNQKSYSRLEIGRLENYRKILSEGVIYFYRVL